MMRALGLSAVSISVAATAMAQEASPFNTDDCPERTGYRWCASKAAAAGWRLKYESKSPANLADASWNIEVWVRGHEAMLCESHNSRGGIPVNSCQGLRENAE
jgi:hypothetical protein